MDRQVTGLHGAARDNLFATETTRKPKREAGETGGDNIKMYFHKFIGNKKSDRNLIPADLTTLLGKTNITVNDKIQNDTEENLTANDPPKPETSEQGLTENKTDNLFDLGEKKIDVDVGIGSMVQIRRNQIFSKKASGDVDLGLKFNIDTSKSPVSSTQKINNRAENFTELNNSFKSASLKYRDQYMSHSFPANEKIEEKVNIENFKNKIKYQFNWNSPSKSFSNHPTNKLADNKSSSNYGKFADHNQSYAVRASKKRFLFNSSPKDSSRVSKKLQHNLLYINKATLMNSPESPVRGVQNMSKVNTSFAEGKQTFLGEKISGQKKSLRKFSNTITNISVNLGGTASKAAHKKYFNEANGGMNRNEDADRKAELLCGTNSKIGGKRLDLSWNNSTLSNTHNAFSSTANKIKNLASGNKKDAPPNSHKKDLNTQDTPGMATGSGKKNSFLNKTLTQNLNATTLATID
jgi:hypothetical protein